ncbi:MAG: hypothetical protein IPG50_39160 [Myxococcales bacterium]|nr:hypothetical protein [Myxococcales bacterium]
MKSIGWGVSLCVSAAMVFGACSSDSEPAAPTPSADGGTSTDAASGTDTATAADGSTSTDSATATDTSTPDATASDSAADAPAVSCTTDSKARPKALNILTTNSTGAGTMKAEFTGCAGTAAASYTDGTRAMVDAPSSKDFVVTTDPTETTKYYPGASQVLNFNFAGTGDDEDSYLAPKAGTFGSITVSDLLPGFNVTKSHIVAKITSIGQTTPCDVASGFVVTVPGHAEAVVNYLEFTGTAISIKAGATATVTGTSTALSFVSIEGITPGAPIVLSGTKTGCQIVAITRPFNDTGKVPLLAGRVAGMTYRITP